MMMTIDGTIDSRIVRIGCMVMVAAWLVVGSTALAGEVGGRIVQTSSRAHVGEMMGGLASMSTALGAGAPAGPVLVYIGEATSEMPRRSAAPVRMRMTAGGLTPSLQAVCVGSTVEFENADASAHRVAADSRRGGFDLGWQAGGTTRTIEVREVGLMTLRCTLKNQPIGELVVLPHSCFALADAGGQFRLVDVPPGPAVIVAYAPGKGEISRRVEIPADGRAEVDLSF